MDLLEPQEFINELNKIGANEKTIQDMGFEFLFEDCYENNIIATYLSEMGAITVITFPSGDVKFEIESLEDFYKWYGHKLESPMYQQKIEDIPQYVFDYLSPKMWDDSLLEYCTKAEAMEIMDLFIEIEEWDREVEEEYGDCGHAWGNHYSSKREFVSRLEDELSEKYQTSLRFI